MCKQIILIIENNLRETTYPSYQKILHDESYYILTLAALAKELMLRGKYREKVIMGVGLPLTNLELRRKTLLTIYQGKVRFILNLKEKISTLEWKK